MWKYEELFLQLKSALEQMEQGDSGSAEHLLEQVKEQLDGKEEYRELLGEWCLLMARLYFYDLDKAVSYLERAREQIRGYSKVIPCGTEFGRDVYGPLFLYLKVPGTADETGKKLERVVELYDSLCDGNSQYAQIYYAQLAYYRGDFQKALDLFLKAGRIARRTGNAFDQLCAAEYQTRIAFHMRNPVVWTQTYNFISGMQTNENRVIRELAACTKSQIRMSLGLLTELPKWITGGRFGAISAGADYRILEDKVSHHAFPVIWITYIEYLLYSGEFYSVLNGADIASSLFGLDKTLLYSGYLKIYKASAWNAIGDQKKTVELIREAVKILEPDGLWLFGAEFFQTLGPVFLKEIEPFGDAIIKRYMDYSREYSGKLKGIQKMYTESVFREPLTEKERLVARLAALGFKNEEIGEHLSISRNTVKYHLANVYKKLEISNRVELRAEMDAHRQVEHAYWTELIENVKE